MDAQSLAVLAIVIAAAGFLAWKFTRKKGGSCAGCGTCGDNKKPPGAPS